MKKSNFWRRFLICLLVYAIFITAGGVAFSSLLKELSTMIKIIIISVLVLLFIILIIVVEILNHRKEKAN